LSSFPETDYAIVTEGYLGKMYSNFVAIADIAKQKAELSQIYLDFLSRLISTNNPPKSIVITLPCWQTKSDIERLNIIDQIEKLGYTLKQFKSVNSLDMIYKRKTSS
jgi:hypothetical protein